MQDLFAKMAFLYVGTSNFEVDFHYYRDILGAKLVWAFNRFGAKVAAFKLGESPLILIADHLAAPSTMPMFAVSELSSALEELRSRGWLPENGPIEMPNGPCYTFQDPSGNRYAIFADIRPLVMENAYLDSSNSHRILG